MNEATNHEVTNPQSKKVVLITGGAMGQGRAHAVKFAENGFNVVLADMLALAQLTIAPLPAASVGRISA